MTNQLPVVLVHGMLGFGPGELGEFNYWGSALDVQSPLMRIEASVGPLSSIHDRACELAAQLKGAPVDYGEEHAAANGHERFGRDYRGQALWPDWDGDHALHMVGHSLGAATIRALQNLLARDYWGWGSSTQWIASLSAISGTLNGSTAIYYFGADLKTGLLRRSGGIAPILRLLEVYTAFSNQTLDSIYDFDLDHWGFEPRKGEDLPSYLRRVGQTQFFWGADNAFYDVSLQGAYRANGRWLTFPGTYYFTYITEQTFRMWPRGYHYPSPLMNPAMQPPSWHIGRMQFAQPPFPDDGFNSGDWWENDGLVPTFSQAYPRTNGNHPVGEEITLRSESAKLAPGRWHRQWERGFDHMAICVAPRPWQRARQRHFYEELFSRLAQLEVN